MGKPPGIRSSKRINNTLESLVQHEIFKDILLRLPMKDVFRCCCVCRRWNHFISAQNFIDLHSRKSLPLILAEDPHTTINGNFNYNRYFFDKWWETHITLVSYKSKNLPNYRICFSQAGFVVLRQKNCVSSVSFIVHNPLYHDEVKIVFPQRLWADVYGIFFHPNLNEYCMLWGVSLFPYAKLVQYKLLNLGPEPYWRDLNSQWCRRPKFGLSCSVIIDHFLYWMLVFEKGAKYNGCFDVMEFDTASEEFRLLPCPIPETLGGCDFNVNVLSNDGFLSLVRTSLEEKLFVIHIWTLKDRVEQLWISSMYSIKNEEDYHPENRARTLALVDNELVIITSGKKLFVCNLELGITNNWGYKIYNHGALFLSHVMTLASLKNCKRKIVYLEESDGMEGRIQRIECHHFLCLISELCGLGS